MDLHATELEDVTEEARAAATPNRRILSVQRGSGDVGFYPAHREDMPTQYMIVNAIQALPMLEARGATVVKTVGGKDLSDQRILR